MSKKLRREALFRHGRSKGPVILRTVLFAGFGALAWSSTAFAQQMPAPPVPPASVPNQPTFNPPAPPQSQSGDSGGTSVKRAGAPPGSPRHKGPVTALASNGGDKVASVADDGSIILWTLADGQLVTARQLVASAEVTTIATLRGHDDRVESAVFSPDGSRVVTASNDNTRSE